jgi:hypothetical protein
MFTPRPAVAAASLVALDPFTPALIALEALFSLHTRGFQE